MSEFRDRLSAQRGLLLKINRDRIWKENLMGLSRAAIERWLAANSISSTSGLALLILKAGGQLAFLANKSQDQVTEEYQLLVRSFNQTFGEIDLQLRSSN